MLEFDKVLNLFCIFLKVRCYRRVSREKLFFFGKWRVGVLHQALWEIGLQSIIKWRDKGSLLASTIMSRYMPPYRLIERLSRICLGNGKGSTTIIFWGIVPDTRQRASLFINIYLRETLLREQIPAMIPSIYTIACSFALARTLPRRRRQDRLRSLLLF